MTRRNFLISLAAWASFLMGHTPYRQWYVYRKKRLIIAASERDEASVRLGKAVAQALSVHLPESKAMLATAATSLDVAKLLKSQQLDVALLPSDEAHEALEGVGSFRGWGIPLRALAVLQSSVLHLVTLGGNGIKTVSDLKGKTLGTGLPGSRTEVTILRVLDAYGIDPERDLRRQSLSGDHAIAALRDKKVDAFAWVDIVPSEAIRDLAPTPAFAITLVDHGDALPKMEAKHGPIYHLQTIPKAAYPFLPADVGAAAVAHLLVCRDDFPQEKAYQISKTLAEHRAELALAGFSLGTLPAPLDKSPLAFHPGALQFYEGRPLEEEKGR